MFTILQNGSRAKPLPFRGVGESAPPRFSHRFYAKSGACGVKRKNNKFTFSVIERKIISAL